MEVFQLGCLNKIRTRSNYLNLICPVQKTNTGQNALSFNDPSIWNKTSKVLKKQH